MSIEDMWGYRNKINRLAHFLNCQQTMIIVDEYRKNEIDFFDRKIEIKDFIEKRSIFFKKAKKYNPDSCSCRLDNFLYKSSVSKNVGKEDMEYM